MFRTRNMLKNSSIESSLNELISSLSELPDHPSSAANEDRHVTATLLGAKSVYSRLVNFGQIVGFSSETLLIEEFKDSRESNLLRDLFDNYGSDKGSFHGYHVVYAHLIKLLNDGPLCVGEIGLGTNFVDIPSNMGPEGKPGASLRAWRDFLGDDGSVFGFDVDRRILFEEKGIKTYFVDQLSLDSFEALKEHIAPKSLDLLIDDGLHAPLANLNVLISAPFFLKKGGFLVVEDIGEKSLPVWQLICALKPSNWEIQMLKTAHANMFIARIH